MRAAGALLAAAIAALLAWSVQDWWSAPEPREPLTPDAASASPPTRTLAVEDTGAVAPRPPPPPSLRGTRPSGSLEVDEQGHFVPTPEALLFFEYFLSAAHEEPVPQLLARMRAAIRDRLEPPADAEAEAFLERYVAYLDAGAQRFDDPELARGVTLERRLQWIRELRREHFGADLAERLFREEEDATTVVLEMRRIGRDPSLGEAERRARLAAAAERHPERVREARGRAIAPLLQAREEQALRESGADEAEIHALRIERLGPEAAERMRALDLQRAAWQERLARYREERDALERQHPAGQEQLLEALRRAHFDEVEAVRVRILDRMEERAPP